jgi:hypothetical protein
MSGDNKSNETHKLLTTHGAGDSICDLWIPADRKIDNQPGQCYGRTDSGSGAMTLWAKRLELARRNLTMMANTPGVPNYLIAEHSRLFLKAYHKGSWHMLFAMTKYELRALWRHHGWLKWEWIRTKVLRREQDPVLSIAQRVVDEEYEVNRLNNDLDNDQ